MAVDWTGSELLYASARAGGRGVLLHPLLSLVLLISYKDARITSNRESMNLLPEKKMKTF